MSDFVIRPSTKLVKPFYTFAFFLVCGVFFINNNRETPIQWLWIAPGLVVARTLIRHIRLRFTKLTVANGSLRYQTGMVSRATRTLDLSKVQDIRVEQSFIQRMIGIGTLSLETAGETGGLTMRDVDHPQRVADTILHAGREGESNRRAATR